MKKVISFSLWGDKPIYWKGAKNNIKLCQQYLKDWICRFYIDNTCNKNLIDTITGENVEIILVNPSISFHGMFWRFYAASDIEVDILLVRDTDSRITEREILAVEEWLKTDKDFHIMRDHPYHTVPILGGMWGCRNKILLNMYILIENWLNHTSKKGQWKDVQVAGDQNFLAEVVYPLIYKNAFEHSEFGLKLNNIIYSFPSKRINYEFIGDVFDENNTRHPEYWKIIKQYS